MRDSWAELLWGRSARVSYLLLAAVIILFAFLGSRDLWTQEHRWADIVSAMFYHHDYLHPSLNGVEYYDKPLLSYWFIAVFVKLFGTLSTWTLRLPSALAGLLAVWSIYRLGTTLKDRQLGLLAGWMLLTTYYFIFWARTSSADMLNVAGTLFAITWYFEKKSQPAFFNYAVFFLTLAVTALCKGLVGPVVVALALLPDLIQQGEWKKHLRGSFALALLPAAVVYVLPFWASAHFGAHNYHENGLYLVYRENILRYFQPFDHKGPIYTYFIFLPIYLLPWAFFFIPALWSLKSRWQNMSAHSKWLVWATLLLFVFLTVSGSRRNYYVLPLVPFALLLTADWMLTCTETLKRNMSYCVILFAVLFFVAFDVIQPLYYSGGGIPAFSQAVKQTAEKNKPWSAWQVVLLDPESKVRFYLQLAPEVKNYLLDGEAKQVLSQATANTIFITRKKHVPALQATLKNYTVVAAKARLGERLLNIDDPNLPVAFIPQ